MASATTLQRSLLWQGIEKDTAQYRQYDDNVQKKADYEKQMEKEVAPMSGCCDVHTDVSFWVHCHVGMSCIAASRVLNTDVCRQWIRIDNLAKSDALNSTAKKEAPCHSAIQCLRLSHHSSLNPIQRSCLMDEVVELSWCARCMTFPPGNQKRRNASLRCERETSRPSKIA